MTPLITIPKGTIVHLYGPTGEYLGYIFAQKECRYTLTELSFINSLLNAMDHGHPDKRKLNENILQGERVYCYWCSKVVTYTGIPPGTASKPVDIQYLLIYVKDLPF